MRGTGSSSVSTRSVGPSSRAAEPPSRRAAESFPWLGCSTKWQREYQNGAQQRPQSGSDRSGIRPIVGWAEELTNVLGPSKRRKWDTAGRWH
jgi:hypothetical protein